MVQPLHLNFFFFLYSVYARGYCEHYYTQNSGHIGYKSRGNLAGWRTPFNYSTWRQREEKFCEFEANLDYVMRLCLKKKKT